ncbi:MAG: hypothetical protein ABMA64_23775 [Myxococcota bacterium]
MARSLLLVALGALRVAGCDAEVPPPPVGPSLPPPELWFPPSPGTAAAEADSWYADCGPGMTFAMADLLPPIAAGLSHQQIPYGRTDPDEWRDCSGNFLRLSSYLAAACPAGSVHLAAPAGVPNYVAGEANAPELAPLARSSRDLAQWYRGEGRFVPVWYPADRPVSEVLAGVRHLIKAGSVVWFARSPPRADFGVNQLFTRNLRGTAIHHVGTVVATERDEQGDVVRYAMYHAGNTDRVASVTDEHRFVPTGGGPPFGNGPDYLVGIGTLLPIAPPPRRTGDTAR